jgi:hypothetical protein
MSDALTVEPCWSVTNMVEMVHRLKLRLEKLKERDRLEDLDVDGKLPLKLFFMKQVGY